MKEIQLHGKLAAGRVALVDDEDYELVAPFRWNCHEVSPGPGRRPSGPYARTTQPYAGPPPTPRRPDGRVVTTQIFMHILIMGQRGIDHINHYGLDNQRSNLRVATVAQNTRNMRPGLGATSPYRGVCWSKTKRNWRVMIMREGRYAHVGSFTDEIEAARAYDAAAREAFGEFAYLNFGGVA